MSPLFLLNACILQLGLTEATVERLFKVLIVIVAVAALLIGAAWLFLKHQTPPVNSVGTQPTAPVVASTAATSTEDPCREAIVLTLQSHSGVSASMVPQTLDGQDIPTQEASAEEGSFTVQCNQSEGVGDPGGSPQTIKICKPTSFVLHITGSGKGVFDLQAKPYPDVAHPVSPLLLCNYALDSDRVYDWVLRYQKGSRPAVFLLGSKGEPNVQP